MSVNSYPVRVTGHLDSPGRWLWLVKWLLAIPHYVVLMFLWLAFFVVSVVAFFAIAITGRYPRGLFDFNVGVLRWSWRVGFYSYSALGTDKYPPFSLGEHPDYPATLEVAYPERLSRGLVWVKWWLLAIPHYLIVGFILGGGAWFAWQTDQYQWSWGGGLIGLLVLIAAVVLAATERYPRPLFDFILGLNRWVLRVAAYAALMTDQYPPFRLDQGEDESGSVTVPPAGPHQGATADTPHAAVAALPARADAGWGAGRVFAVIAGTLLLLVSFGLLAGGGALAFVDQTQREQGYVMSPADRQTTPTYAVVSDKVLIDDSWRWAGDFVGGLRLESESTTPVFIGVAKATDVERYLDGVAHDRLDRVQDGEWVYTRHRGQDTPAAPAEQTFWVAKTQGAGLQTLTWEPEEGEWMAVLLRADGSKGPEAELSVGAELPHLDWAWGGLLVVGVLLFISGLAMVLATARGGRR